jgi:hypothetical protein
MCINYAISIKLISSIPRLLQCGCRRGLLFEMTFTALIGALVVIPQILRRFPRSKLTLLDPKRSSRLDDSAEDSPPDQNRLSKHNIYYQLLYYGIPAEDTSLNAAPNSNNFIPSRVEFARRVSKMEHLARFHNHHLSAFIRTSTYPQVTCVCRQRGMDLFLDTLVYGAHSTATDALRAVL